MLVLQRKYPASMFIMYIVIMLIRKWYVLAIVVLLLVLRAFGLDIPAALPLMVAMLYLAWAVAASLLQRRAILNMMPGNEMLDKMFADNDNGYRNVVDTVNEIIDSQLDGEDEDS